MKKTIITLALLIFASALSYAQSGQKWSANGNIASSGDFIGTTNNEPLILKSNNIVGLRIKPNGQLIIKSLDLNSSAPSGLVLTNGQGEISRLDFNTANNQVLFSNGTWGVIPTSTVSSLWQQSGSNIYTLNNKIGIGTNNPLFPLDVIGDARISNNLYVGGGIVISDKISAITEIKGWDFKVDNDINIEGSSRLKGVTRLDQGFTFDGAKGISFTPSTNTSSAKFHYGSKVLDIPESCAALPQPWANHQFGGMLQIFDADPITGQYIQNSGLLNFQTWSGGSSIDASIGGDMTTSGGLLLNYFCGNDTYINTGALGGIVHLGKTHIGPATQTGTHSDAMLTIDGKIVAKSCYIKTINWADYVFANDYKLPNLYEIEKYYLANKHLPEIPSEKEVIENGVDIVEMNKLLLKKIEEITILMVKQQKEIDALKNK